MSYEVDTVALRGLASTLRGGRDSLEEAGASAPGLPDAGELTADVGRMLSVFAGEAGELSTGVAAVADGAEGCARDYTDTDERVEQRLRGLDG